MINSLLTRLTKLELATLMIMQKITQCKIYAWIWWKLFLRSLAHVCKVKNLKT